MVETAGNKLRRARQMRQLSLEDAARATKIRENQLVDLEADDYSNFANLAYARSFLVNYGKYLKVDMRPHVEAFADANTFGLDDYQYLSETPVGMYRIPYRRSSRSHRPKRRQLIGTAVGLAALAMGVVCWYVIVSVQRLGPLDRLAARQEAREKASREGTNATATTTTTVPAAPSSAAPAPRVDVDGLPTLPAPGGVIPVSAPVNGPAAERPASSVAPGPADAPAPVAIPALAGLDEPNVPHLPLPGDGHVMREMLTAHTVIQPQPQKVVNDHPRGQ